MSILKLKHKLRSVIAIEGQEYQSNSDVTDYYICDDIICSAMSLLLNLNNDRFIYIIYIYNNNKKYI